jgi:EpsI family protein
MKAMKAFFGRRTVITASLVLVVQAYGFHVFSQNEHEPKTLPLQLVNTESGGWVVESQEALDTATAENLNPDDYLYRLETNAELGTHVSLFVAYFKTQRTGHAPHTPRNCLPGHGWTPSSLGTVALAVPGHQPIDVNHYMIAKERSQSVVIYWYQTATRTVANEYLAKLYLIWDAIRHKRSDTAMVRVIVPVVGGDVGKAERAAREFSVQVYTALAGHFPGFS